jgi:hypothetical protein
MNPAALMQGPQLPQDSPRSSCAARLQVDAGKGSQWLDKIERAA